ncbi:MAG: asparagine N-glycosylation enzyme membrane subunit Stt3 [Chlamydiales bacterium]|jgi:asparagine N-glycosylation enzyme membrane subunit Stt3
MPAAQKRIPTLIWILLAVALSAFARGVQGARWVLPDAQAPGATSGAGSTAQPVRASLDPDSLYHVRRIDRMLVEGSPVAQTDGYLNYPAGAAIPWPPYYTWLASCALAPFAPEETEARRRWVEFGAATLPFLFGVLTTLLVAVAGFLLAGNAGAAVAGITHALTSKSIYYSSLGNADHHAWVSLCLALLATLFSLALRGAALERRRPALLFGLALGAIAGLAIGSWVGALMYIVLVELLLGVLIVIRARHAGARYRSLPTLGLAFHVAAILVLAPAVLASPWRTDAPWMVINLSWFHPGFLLLGGAVFLPLALIPANGRVARQYPWIVLGALAVLATVGAALDLGPARGMREAFEWAGRGDAFMARVAESDPLSSLGPRRFFAALGFALALLPLIWPAALRAGLRGHSPALLPWILWTPFLAYQAAEQQRFAEPFAIPLAVLTGWGVATLLATLPSLSRKRASRWLAPALGSLIALALQFPGLKQTADRARSVTWGSWDTGASQRPIERLGLPAAVRLLCEWIRTGTPDTGDYSVLAFWHWGHVIEWAADRPSVATNFGSYVGRDSFLDPSRFFMSDDDEYAEALLEQRQARYVLVTSHLLNGMKTLIQAVPRERWPELVEVGAQGIESLGKQRPGLLRTVGARISLLELLAPQASYRPVPFLRLVHVSRVRDARAEVRPSGAKPIRMGSVWEHVSGARIEAHGEPGTELTARLWIDFPESRFQLLWQDSAIADGTGVASVRVPYSTEVAAGDGMARGPVRWNFGELGGDVSIPDAAVRDGDTVTIQ